MAALEKLLKCNGTCNLHRKMCAL